MTDARADNDKPRARPHLIVVGGGFAGLNAVRRLSRAPVDITLIDRNNYHLFQPLLYQVATGALSPADIAAPLRSILRKQKNARVIMAEVREIRPEQRQVVLPDRILPYDMLVLATGATHSYFGHPEWAACAPGLKTLPDALEIRSRIYAAFEAAEQETDPDRIDAWMTFVVVGAGPTGVELVGALSEIARAVLIEDFRTIDPTRARVILLEGANRVLGSFDADLSGRAQKQLEKLGVDVRLDKMVTGVDESGVFTGDEHIRTHNIIWAAGVRASSLGATLASPTDRAGRVKVDAYLHPEGHDDVFVLGDLAGLEQDGHPVPGVAPAAIQQGNYVAHAIARSLAGKPVKPFRYRDKGAFAVIGRGAAVGRIGRRLRLSGPIAWLAWLAIHITFLVGFRNRVAVLLGWAYEYVTFKRGTRLITVPPAMGVKSPPPQAGTLEVRTDVSYRD